MNSDIDSHFDHDRTIDDGSRERNTPGRLTPYLGKHILPFAEYRLRLPRLRGKEKDMCHEGDSDQPIPSNNRDEINRLIAQLHEAQHEATKRIQAAACFANLEYATPDAYSVKDTLREWVWHFWTHQRDLGRARDPLTNDDPHFHVPHFVRQAHEEFGRYIGELSCLSDEYLDVRPPGGGRTVRESVEHVLDTLRSHFACQIEHAQPPDSANSKIEE